jgi:uncharacterized protein YceH (UPF0502 family)
MGVPMMTEERTRYEVLLEDIQTSMKVLAEGHGALVERLDRMEGRIEDRFDGFERRFDRIEVKVDGLEVFASDAQRRLDRIETHLQLNGASHASPRRKAASDAPPKRRKKS